MDNFRIDVNAAGDILLRDVMRIVFTRHSHATHYMLWPGKGLVFFWTEPRAAEQVGAPEPIGFPFKMDADGAAEFARRWLADTEYPKQPDHDGDNSKGWRVYNEAWGHIGNYWSAIIAVQPTWAMHGK